MIFNYLSQEFDNVLDLVKQKGFYPHEYMSDFEILAKKTFILYYLIEKLVTENMNMYLMFVMNFISN